MNAYDVHGLSLAVEGEPEATSALERRLRGFPRIRVDNADLVLRYVTDLGEAGVTLPATGSRAVYEAGGSEVHFFPDADVLAADLDGVRLHADLSGGVTHLASAAFRDRQRYVAAHPLTTLAFLEMLKRRGRFCLHAACLARDGRAVVIAGQAGAGKSTLALGLARAGLDYLGDDMMFLRREGETVHALGFSDAVGVTPNTAAWLHELAGLAEHPPDPGFPKHLVRVDDHFNARVVSEAVPAMLVFPQIVPGDTSRLEPLAPNEAWLRLVPDILLTEPTSTQAHLDTVTALTTQVECFTLFAGGDLDTSANLVAERL